MAEQLSIGVDLGGTKIEAVALQDDGREARRLRIASPQGSYDNTVAAIRDLVAAISQGLDCAPEVGVGIPGTISPVTRLVKNANSTWLIGHPFDRDLAAALQRPVRLANDANCFAISEATDGAAAGAAVVFGVILGTGIGSGLVVHGRVVGGINGVAGEWGHNPLPWPTNEERPGRACYCGRSGCIETFLSGPGLAADHAAATGECLTAAQIAAADTPGANASLSRYEQRLARGLAHVINILDPDMIVLGGSLGRIGRLYTNVPKLWTQWVFGREAATRLVAPHHGDASGVRGAARLWRASFPLT
jgi:fructokinase